MLFEINYIGHTFHLRSDHYAYNYVFKCVLLHICHHKTYEREAQYSNEGDKYRSFDFIFNFTDDSNNDNYHYMFLHTLHAISYLISKTTCKIGTIIST